MDMIISQDSRKINLLAIYNLLPLFTGELLQHSLNETGRFTFTILESYLHMRVLNNGDLRFTSPQKITNASTGQGLSTKVKINIIEKVSSRAEAIKAADVLLEIDILDYFVAKMNETQANLNIQPGLQVLAQFISDENYRQSFLNIV